MWASLANGTHLGRLETCCDNLLETIASRNVSIEFVRSIFRITNLMLSVLVTCKFQPLNDIESTALRSDIDAWLLRRGLIIH